MPSIKVKWGKELYTVEVDDGATVGMLRQRLYDLTSIPADKQKILGTKPGKLADDSLLRDAGITEGKSLMLIGHAEGTVKLVQAQAAPLEPTDGVGFTATSIQSNGLKNIANTCYLNSALQMLRTIPELAPALTAYTGSNAFVRQLGALLHHLDHTKETLTPLAMWTALLQHNSSFAEKDEHGMFVQHDSQEVLSLILQQLIPATEGGSSSSSNNSNDSSSGSVLPASLAQLFRGTLHQTLQCIDDPNDTGKESDTSFTMLTCNIGGEVQTLEAGLEQAFNERFTAPSDALQRDSATFTRRSRIAALPEYIFVHMVRFSWRGDIQKKAKILKPISFPTILDLGMFATEELKRAQAGPRAAVMARREQEWDRRRRERHNKTQHAQSPGAPQRAAEEDGAGTAAATEPLPAVLHNESGFYELCGVISHKGRSADGGHYVYWGRKAHGWLVYDDEHVAQVTEEDVQRLRGVGEAHIAYVLLYRSRNPNTHQPVIPI